MVALVIHHEQNGSRRAAMLVMLRVVSEGEQPVFQTKMITSRGGGGGFNPHVYK